MGFSHSLSAELEDYTANDKGQKKAMDLVIGELRKSICSLLTFVPTATKVGYELKLPFRHFQVYPAVTGQCYASGRHIRVDSDYL